MVNAYFSGLQKKPNHLRPVEEADLIEASRKTGREYLLTLSGWSVEEYFQFAPEGRICEYLEGTITVASPASTTHQRIVQFLARLLAAYVEEGDLGAVFNGPATIKVSDAYFEPDIFFVRRQNESHILESHVDCAPDFVIEVVSESTRNRDLRLKLARYQEAAVAEYWAIDYRRQEVSVWRREADGYTALKVQRDHLVSAAVPGFAIEIDWLWQRPLPKTVAT
jgi:Uma2 family endonuclease